MMYLIGQLSVWLLLAAGFAAFAGWMFAARRAAPARRSLRNARDRLVRDLAQLAAGEAAAPEAAIDTSESLSRIREGRIAELERALESARGRADDADAEAAELRRALEGGGAESGELTRLRSLVAEHEQQRAREIEAEVVEPGADDDGVLQSWRLRYFEQRVRYLESLAQAPAQAAAIAPPEPAPPQIAPQMEWRARDAEARAAHLEQELRALTARPDGAAETEPFAADADVDALLRWRLLYLERRVAHLQQRAAAPAGQTPQPAEAGSDSDRWKWRARYLEARVRHLEQRPAPAPVAAAAPEAERVAPARPARRGVKPPVLASARNGAPDDLTLIEGVSLQQQSTFYSLGVFHFDQIAAWTPDEVAWVDQYLRLGGRIEDEEWVEQADELAREGPLGARRTLESESA